MVTSEAGNTVELYAPAELLTGLLNGDAVTVKVSGDNITFFEDAARATQCQQRWIGGKRRRTALVRFTRDSNILSQNGTDGARSRVFYPAVAAHVRCLFS